MLPKSLQNLVDQLKKLPGIGPKTAEHLAFFLLRSHRSFPKELGSALLNMHAGVNLCSQCFTLSEKDLCKICDDPTRNHSLICVVEEMVDAIAVEATHEYHGLYHVLHGRISPLDHMHPKDLKIEELISRLTRSSKNGRKVEEIIIATNPDMEGETTALYLAKVLKPLAVRLTRIARGLPVGSNLEYADQITLTRALDGRQEFGI